MGQTQVHQPPELSAESAPWHRSSEFAPAQDRLLGEQPGAYLTGGGVAGKRRYLGYRRGPHERRKLGEVAAANPKTFFQIYWMGSKDDMVARMERARAAGAAGLIATLDWSFSVGRDWGSPEIPERIDLYTALRFAPQVLTRPRWLYEFARTRRLPDLTAPNLAQPGEAGADVLRRPLRVDADPGSHLGGRGVAAFAVGRAVPA